MSKNIWVICIFLASVVAYGQPKPNYEVATIVEVKQVRAATDTTPGSYEVWVRVGDTIYQTLYTPLFDTGTVPHAPGHDLLVLVGEKTITYNDMLGRSFSVPIISKKPAAAKKRKETRG